MRLAFLILLLINIGLFAVTSGLLGAGRDGSEPLRLASQIKPDSIRILSPDDSTSKVAVKPEAPGDSPAAGDGSLSCLLLSGLARDQVDVLGARIRERQLDVESAETELTETTAWWVHIPGLQSRQLAERKQAELRALGVGDMIIMAEPTDSQKLAISLGLFKSEMAAKEHLATVTGKGVRTARILPREGRAGRYRVELRGAQSVLDALLAGSPDVTGGAERAECP